MVLVCDGQANGEEGAAHGAGVGGAKADPEAADQLTVRGHTLFPRIPNWPAAPSGEGWSYVPLNYKANPAARWPLRAGADG